MIKYLFVIPLIFLSICTQAQDADTLKSSLQERTRMSFRYSYPSSSGEMNRNFITLNRGIDYLKGGHWNWLNAKNGKNNVFKASLRLIKSVALDRTIAQNTTLFNHEFFGHGLAINDMNFRLDSLHVPFNFFGNTLFRITKDITSDQLPFGVAAYLAFEFKDGFDYSLDQVAATYASGIAASDVLRYTLQDEWIKNDQLTYNDAMLYLTTHWDYSNYLLNTSNGFGADASNYLTIVNIRNIEDFPEALYSDAEGLEAYADENFQFKPGEMKVMAILNALGDPYLYSSLFSVFSYIVKGKTHKKLPYINLNGVKFIPSIGAHLSPFGLSYTLRTPIVHNDSKIHLALNYGSIYDNKYFGIGFKMLGHKDIKKWKISPHLELFSQPKFEYGIENTTEENDIEEIGGFGGMLALNFEKIFNHSKLPIFINGRVGYKTAGYIPGESIKSTPVLSIEFGTLLK